jgi:hypothetical protein
MEPSRVCMPKVVDPHHFDEDSDSDPLRIEKPDPLSRFRIIVKKSDPDLDLYQRDAVILRFRQCFLIF